MATGNNMSETSLELPDLESEMREERDLDETSKPITKAAAEEHVTDFRDMPPLKSAQPCTSNAVSSKKRKYKEYSCSYCGKYFKHKGNMQQHVRTHTQERPFSCNLCGMSYKKSSALLEHRRRHKGLSQTGSRDKFFDCEICNRSFLSKNSLTVHLRVHSDELNFRCKTCGKYFRHKSSLSRHSLIHTGDRKYTCDYCQRKFYDASDMRKHLAIHTGHKKYQCVHCGKRFIQSSSYRTHLKTHSSDKKLDNSNVKVCSEYGQSGTSDSELLEDNSDLEIIGENSENESIVSVDEDEILHIARNLDKSCDSYSRNKLEQLSCTNINDKPLEEECTKPSQQLQTSFRSNYKEHGTLRKSNSETELNISETTDKLRSKIACVVKTDTVDDEVSCKPNDKEINQGGNSDNLIKMVSLDSMEVTNEHSNDDGAYGSKKSASISYLSGGIVIDNDIDRHLYVSGNSDPTRKQVIIVDEVTNYPCIRNVEGLDRKNLEDSIISPKVGKYDKGSSKTINVVKSNVKDKIEVITNDKSEAVRPSVASRCFSTDKKVADTSNITHADNAMQSKKIIPDKERSNREVESSIILKEYVCSNVFITVESNDVHEKGSENNRSVLLHASVEEPAHIGTMEKLMKLVDTNIETHRNCNVPSNKQQGNPASLKQTRHETRSENPDRETQSMENNFSLEQFNKIENTKSQSEENVKVEQNSNVNILSAWLIKGSKAEKSKENVFKGRKAEKSKEGVKAKKCRHCEMFFEDNTLYLQHLREHWKNKTFTCEDCLKAFAKWRDYSHHECNKTKSRKTKDDYACAYCNKRFKTKKILKKHTQMKRKSCNGCTRIFCSSKDLIKHSQTHLKKSNAFHYRSKLETDSDQEFNAKFTSFDNFASSHGVSEADIEAYSSRDIETDNLPSLSNKDDCHRLSTLEKEDSVSDSLPRTKSKENDEVFSNSHETTVSKYENYYVTKVVTNDKGKTVSAPSKYCDKGSSGSSDKLIISNKLFMKKSKMLTGKRMLSKKLEMNFKGTGKLKDKLYELYMKERGTDHGNEEDAVETNIYMMKPNKTVTNKNESRMNETTQNKAFVATDNFSKKNPGSDRHYGSSVSDTVYFEKLHSSARKGQNLSARTSTLECCDEPSEEDEQNQSSSDSESTSVEDDGSYEEVVLYKDLKMEEQGDDKNMTSDIHFLNSFNEPFIEKVMPRGSVCRPLSIFRRNDSSCSVNIECKNKSRSKAAQRIKYNLRNKDKAQRNPETKKEMAKTTDFCESSNSESEEDSVEGSDSASDEDSEGYEECTKEEVQAMLSGL